MVGNELGAGNLKRGKLYGTRMMKISFVCGVAMMVLMGISAPFILHFVKLTPQATVYLKGMFVVLCVYMIGRSVNEITINGVFGSGGDTMFDVYSLAVTMWGIAIPLAALGTYRFHWPVIVVYACTCIDKFIKNQLVVSLRISTGVICLWIGFERETGLLFFRSSICCTRSSIAVLAIRSICCPTVVIGRIASLAIGELSNPTSS